LKVLAPTIGGDFDGNGVVDSNDLNAWNSGFGKAAGATRSQGDGDGDGDVDGNDFLAWQRGLGQPTAAVTAAAVPEGSSLAMLLTAFAVGGGLARRR
jgi:hypothetical protein